jgi:hypothetical protein
MVLTGQALWCAFITPDAFAGDVEKYKGKILIKESEATELMAWMDASVEAHWEKVTEAKPNKKWNQHPMYQVSEKYEGYIEIQFKQNAEVKLRDGSLWTPKPVIYNSKAQRDEDLEVIPNGATIRVAWQPVPWDNAGQKNLGLRMRPVSVQVVDMGTGLPGPSGGGNPFAAFTEEEEEGNDEQKELEKGTEVTDTEGEEAVNF